MLGREHPWKEKVPPTHVKSFFLKIIRSRPQLKTETVSKIPARVSLNTVDSAEQKWRICSFKRQILLRDERFGRFCSAESRSCREPFLSRAVLVESRSCREPFLPRAGQPRAIQPRCFQPRAVLAKGRSAESDSAKMLSATSRSIIQISG